MRDIEPSAYNYSEPTQEELIRRAVREVELARFRLKCAQATVAAILASR